MFNKPGCAVVLDSSPYHAINGIQVSQNMNQDNIVVVIPSVETLFQSQSVKDVWRSKKRKKMCDVQYKIH